MDFIKDYHDFYNDLGYAMNLKISQCMLDIGVMVQRCFTWKHVFGGMHWSEVFV